MAYLQALEKQKSNDSCLFKHNNKDNLHYDQIDNQLSDVSNGEFKVNGYTKSKMFL